MDMRSSIFLCFCALAAFYLDGCDALSNPQSSADAMQEFEGHPPGVSIFLRQNGGSFRAWFTFEYTQPDGGKFDKTIFLTKSISGGQDTFIPARFGGASDECPYAPRLKKVCIDHGRDAKVCRKGCVTYSGPRAPTEGSTNWKQCLRDKYRSCSFFRCKCKTEVGVDIVAYGENGQLIVPSSIENAEHCASPFTDF